MATKAEQAKYDAQRSKSKKKKPAPAKAKPKTPRRSRATRIKKDSNLNLREEMTKGSPEQRARKSAARAKRARGSR